MAFYLDDIPAEPFVIEPPADIDLDAFTGADAELVDPAGTVTTLDASLVGEDIVVEQPAVSAFTVAGVHELRLRLTGDGTRRLPPVRIVVQDPASEWHTVDSARAAGWADAEHLGDVHLHELLEVARHDVLEYAPTLADGAPVPSHYRLGQLMQARNLLNAASVDPRTGEDGIGSFAIRPFPLDWQIKQTLRPKRGIPVVY